MQFLETFVEDGKEFTSNDGYIVWILGAMIVVSAFNSAILILSISAL